jgi:glutamyl-tRNA reductase
MTANLRTISLSYKNAPVAVRELLSLDESLCKALMVNIQNFSDAVDILVLSTCNRTEIYYSSEKDYSKEIILLLGIQKGIPNMTEYYSFFNLIENHKESVQHLFEVSIGLDSLVVGDAQISNQVKQAYQWSADLSMAGPFLHRLMHTIFFTHKKIVQTTSFRDGTASVSYATLELAESLCTGLEEPKILIVGLGEMGLDVCRHFAKSKFKNITITNRTISKADDFIKYDTIKIIPFDNLWEAVQEADVIISSVSISEPLFTSEKINKLNIYSYKYFIDLSVPRSVESSIEEKAGILTYNIDEIQLKTTQTLEKRMAAIPFVKQIIEESIYELEDWAKEMEVSPVINKFKDALEQIRQKELGRHLKKLNAAESEKIELITRNIMQKIVKLPVLQLKAACKRGESGALIDVLNELFDLDANENKVSSNAQV